MRITILVGFILVAYALNPEILSIGIGIGLLIIGGICAYIDIKSYELRHMKCINHTKLERMLTTLGTKETKKPLKNSVESCLRDFMDNTYVQTLMATMVVGASDEKRTLQPIQLMMFAVSALAFVKYTTVGFEKDPESFDRVLKDVMSIMMNNEYSRLFAEASAEVAGDVVEQLGETLSKAGIR